VRSRFTKVVLGLVLAFSLMGASYATAEDTAGAKAAVQKVKVIAKDYRLDGIPKKLDAGETVFKFKNKGTEVHEAVIMKLLHGKKIEKLLQLPEKKAMKHVKVIGAVFAKPGKEAKKPLEADLKKGRYVALCFVPTSDETPHFAMGMLHKFRVVN